MSQHRGQLSELGVSERALAFAASLADMEEPPAPQQISFNQPSPVMKMTPGMQQRAAAPVRSAPPPPPRQDPLAAYPGPPPQGMPQPVMPQMQIQQMQQAMNQPPMFRAPPQEMSDYAPHEIADFSPQVPTYGRFPQQQQVVPPDPQAHPKSPGSVPQPMQQIPDNVPQQSPTRQVLLPGLRPSNQASPQVNQMQRAAPPPVAMDQAMQQPADADMQRKYIELERSLKAMESERAVLVREQAVLKQELERLMTSSVKINKNDDAARQYTERLEAEKEDLSYSLKDALNEMEQLAGEKQRAEERLAKTLEVSEKLVEEKEEMLRENEELKESERNAVRGEILNQRFERQEAAKKSQELEDELARVKEENERLKAHSDELKDQVGATAKLLEEKASVLDEMDELTQQKDEALAKLNEQMAINADMEQQMVVFQRQVMELQAAKSDDDTKFQRERDELMDQKDNLERKVLELSGLSQEKVSLASSLLEEKLSTQQEMHDIKTELDNRLDTIEALKREHEAEREAFFEEKRRLQDEVAELGEAKALKAMELADAIKARQTMQAVLEEEKIKVQRELEQAQYDREQARREREQEEKSRAYLTETVDTLTPKLQLREKELKYAINERDTANKACVSLKAELEQERVDAEADRQELLKMLNKASAELTTLKLEKRQLDERLLQQSKYNEGLVQTLSKEVIQNRQANTASMRGNGMPVAGNESMVEHMRASMSAVPSTHTTALA